VPVPPFPSPLDQLGQRRFSFYPPIVNVEHNEWIVRRMTWTDVQVMNTKSSSEISVPRRFLGEVSLIEEPVMIVGLLKELEYKEGVVLPHVRRVIEMPLAVNDAFRPRMRPPEPDRPAPVIGIRLELAHESRVGRRMRAVIAAGILTCVGIAIVLRDGAGGTRVRLAAASAIQLPLTAQDDFGSIVARFGMPAKDRSFHSGDHAYRRLWYPQYSFGLVLMGPDRDHALYIGALDPYGRTIHSVELPDGTNSVSLLRKLR
jgi:hypothetical protein